MKTIFVFVAIATVAAANSVNRAVGWGSQNLKPDMLVDLVGTVLATGVGQASANQALIETALGNANGSAYIQSMSGAIASISQDEGLSQIATADKPSGAISGINVVDAENLAISLDILEGNVGGSIGAFVGNSGAAQSSGEGEITVEGDDYIDVIYEKIKV